MVGILQLREVGWLITGDDRDPVRHLFVRLEEGMDDSGTWTVELCECRGRRGADGNAAHRYPAEADARAALDAIYRLGRHLGPLPTWDPQRAEPGRWRIRVYQPTEQDLRQRRDNRHLGAPPTASASFLEGSGTGAVSPTAATGLG